MLAWAAPRCQQARLWCGVAASQSMIWNVAGYEPTQCDLHRMMMQETPEMGCQDINVTTAQSELGLADFDVTRLPLYDADDFDFEDVKTAIDSGRAVYARICKEPALPSCHAVIIYGYKDCGTLLPEQRQVHLWWIKSCSSSESWDEELQEPRVDYPRKRALSKRVTFLRLTKGWLGIEGKLRDTEAWGIIDVRQSQ